MSFVKMNNFKRRPRTWQNIASSDSAQTLGLLACSFFSVFLQATRTHVSCVKEFKSKNMLQETKKQTLLCYNCIILQFNKWSLVICTVYCYIQKRRMLFTKICEMKTILLLARKCWLVVHNSSFDLTAGWY